MRNGIATRPHTSTVTVAAVAIVMSVTVDKSGHSAQDAHASVASDALYAMSAASTSPTTVFPVSVPVGGTGLIMVNYTVAPAPAMLWPGVSGVGGQGVVVLRFSEGIEVVSPGFEVYPGPVGMGGSAREFAVFYAKKPLPPAAARAFRTEEIAINVTGPLTSHRNFIDVYMVGIDGGPSAGYSAVLEARENTVYFEGVPSRVGGEPVAPPSVDVHYEMSRSLRLSASSSDALPPPWRLAAHLAGVLPLGADVEAWLAGNVTRIPEDYREEVAAAYRALAGTSYALQGTAGAAGASSSQPSFPFPTISSYVYGTLSARGSDGVTRGQAGAAACMYDVGDDNRTLTLLVNLADPPDTRGACTTTNGTGFFDMSVLTLDPTDPRSPVDLRIVFTADAPHSRIADAHNYTYTLHAATVGNLSDPIVGLNVTVPDSHEFRRALWVLGTIEAAHARIAAEFGHDAPAADVRWDTDSPATSSYNRTSGTMTVSSVHGWRTHHGAEASPASIAHVYAQHVLAGLSGSNASDMGPGCPPYLRIDLPASPPGCAWRSGWAHFAAAVVQESPIVRYHHLPVVVNLEAPGYNIGGRYIYGFVRGLDVPGNVAGALWDLYDAPGEPGDPVGGAGAAVWNTTVGMIDKRYLSILDFWHSWTGNKSNPPIRSVLALNGIDIPSDAPPALAITNASLAVPYGETAHVEVNATAAGPVAFELAAAAAANATGLIAAPPAFANLTYQYAGNWTTAALIILAPNASDIGSHLLNVTAHTQGGLLSNTLISVNVTDPVPPYFDPVPRDVYVEATGNLTAVNATVLGVRAHDEVDRRPELSRVPGGPLPLGDHRVRWTATDASNNTATAVMHLFIVDTTPPSFFETPANMSVQFAPGESPQILYDLPNATDIVDGYVPVQCFPPPDSSVQPRSILVVCYAPDRSGNSARASFWFNVTRTGSATTQPLLSLSNTTVVVPYSSTESVWANATGAEAATTLMLSSLDVRGRAEPAPAFARLEYVRTGANATHALIVLSPNASDVGVHRINVPSFLQGAPLARATLTVNITDATSPFLHVPAEAVLEAAGNLTHINASTLDVRSIDVIDSSPSLSANPPGPLPLGAHNVRWTATDASGNAAFAWMRLTAQDTTPPVFGAAPNVTLVFSGGSHPVADYRTPPALDLVDGGDVRVRCLPPPGSPVSWGLTSVVCVALDASDNAAWAQFWINATGGG